MSRLAVWDAKEMGGKMKLSRRNFLRAAAGTIALPSSTTFALEQSYPLKPVHIIVGFTPGGTTDIGARLIGQWLSDRLGQTFVIENRPGAATNIATEAVIQSPADGYTLLATTGANTVNQSLFTKLNFNFIRDVAMIAGIVRSPLVLEVNPSVPAHSVQEFVSYVKTNPESSVLRPLEPGRALM